MTTFASTGLNETNQRLSATLAFSAQLLGSAGNDTLLFDNPNEVVLEASGLGGDDLFELGLDSNGSEILAGAGNDSLNLLLPSGISAELADILNTTILGEDGDDVILLNDGHKSLQDSFIYAEQDNDIINIASQAHLDHGGTRPGLEIAEIGASSIDFIINSTIRGGAGVDKISIGCNGEGPNGCEECSQNDNGSSSVPIEVIQGTLINGNSEDDTLCVQALVINNTSIRGGLGNDELAVDAEQLDASIVSGDQGDDRLTLAAASFASTLRGGSGNDTLTQESSINNNSLLIGNLGNDLIEVAENLSDSSARGGQGNDRLIVGTNDALVNGNQDNDYIYVDDNTGEVYGGIGDDSVVVGAGNGDIIGNEGADTLTGGDGADTFVYSFGDTQLTGVAGFDSINEFRGDSDNIDLTNTDLVFDVTGLTGGITINTDAVITGGINNLQQFVQAGAGLATAGATIGISTASNKSFTSGSFIFISDGDGIRSSGDLLIAFNVDITGLIFSDGDITGIQAIT